MVAVNDEHEALFAIGQALTLAQPEGYIRTFVDFGRPMARLLKKAVTHNIHPQYAGFLLTQFSQGHESRTVTKGYQDTIDSLSVRELDVLAFLATHLSGPEIADQLNISANTLKTHTKNIYGKLGVHSRNDAVIKAQELGLLT